MYLVMEIQKNGDQVSNLVYSYANRNEAESKYYSILSVAALSTVEQHAVTLLTDQGNCIMSRFYVHKAEE